MKLKLPLLFLIIFLLFVLFATFYVNVVLAKKNVTKKPLIFAIHPYLPYETLKERFSPLVNYLAKNIDRKIIIRVGDSYRGHIRAIGENRVDIAFIGPAEYT